MWASEYNNLMLGNLSESRFPRANFCAYHCQSLNDEFWVLNNVMADHYRLNSQQNWEDLYDHLMNMRIFTLMMNNKFIASIFFVANGYGHDLGLVIALHLLPLNCMFHILQQMCAERKEFGFQLIHIYLNKIASYCSFFGLEFASLNPKICGCYSVCLSHFPTSTN